MATHAQAYEGGSIWCNGCENLALIILFFSSGDSNVNVRLDQFRQMREYVDVNIEDGARVVFSGDMNIFTDKYVLLSPAS